MLVDKIRSELAEAADEQNIEAPSLQIVFERLNETGIPTNNLYKWMAKRDLIAQQYKQERGGGNRGLKKFKSVGSGRLPLLQRSEAAVKAIVIAKRESHIRVSRSSVKELLKLKAVELQPEIAAKMSFSRFYFRAALDRMSLVTRPISSTKNVKNEEAAQYGRFMCLQIMELRKNGTCEQLGDVNWPPNFVQDSVFGFFKPEDIFAIDEVPFNFCDDGKTVSVIGQDAAVRCLRGTGKRAGTAVICCSAAGHLSRIVLIFKRNTPWSNKEAAFYKTLSNVIVTYSATSYINEQLWRQQVVDKQVVDCAMNAYGRDWTKRNYILLSDNHKSHQTTDVLAHCAKNRVLPVFSPPNCTPFWSLIDDYTGAALRRMVYRQAFDYEAQYFEDHPDGDGAIDASERRMLLAKWWNEAFDEAKAPEMQRARVNAAKRVGLYVTATKPADDSFLPCPVRFKGTPYKFFGEQLYNTEHPDFQKVKRFDFAFPDAANVRPNYDQVHDEDGFSGEDEEEIVQKEELGQNAEGGNVSEVEKVLEEEEENEDEDEGLVNEKSLKSRAQQRKEASKKIVAQFEDLKAAEQVGKRLRKEARAKKAAERAAMNK